MYTITDRRELIIALNEAVLIEHCLMLQYLYAAFSLKRSEAEGLTWEQSELAGSWKSDCLRVARDEMGHLGTVLNMLNAVGGVPNLQHPNFPLASPRWFPFPFELTPFSEATVRRFVRFEEPQPARSFSAGLPRQPVYDYVGELYRAIRRGFADIGAANPNLFVGDPGAQDSTSWQTLRFAPRPIRSVADAENAIDAIIDQGEGTPDGSDPLAHYATFKRISGELADAKTADPNFDPARPVISNPALRTHPESGTNVTSVDENSFEGRCCAALSEFYAVLLQCLSVHYDGQALSPATRERLQTITRSIMVGIVRPLGEMLTTIKWSGSSSNATCGATFEAIGPVTVPASSPARWTVIRERVQQAAAALLDISKEPQAPPRLANLIPSANALVDIVATLERTNAN